MKKRSEQFHYIITLEYIPVPGAIQKFFVRGIVSRPKNTSRDAIREDVFKYALEKIGITMDNKPVILFYHLEREPRRRWWRR